LQRDKIGIENNNNLPFSFACSSLKKSNLKSKSHIKLLPSSTVPSTRRWRPQDFPDFKSSGMAVVPEEKVGLANIPDGKNEGVRLTGWG